MPYFKVPALLIYHGRQFLGRDGVIRTQQYGFMGPQGARRTQSGPWATHAARIDLDQRRVCAHFPNGFFAERSIRRTGTAPKPSSRRIPLMR